MVEEKVCRSLFANFNFEGLRVMSRHHSGNGLLATINFNAKTQSAKKRKEQEVTINNREGKERLTKFYLG